MLLNLGLVIFLGGGGGGLATFRGSLLSRFISGHNVLTLLSEFYCKRIE